MEPEVVQAILGTPAEGEEQFLATLKSQGVTDDEKINAAVAHFRIQKGTKDLIDDETLATVAKSAGYEGTSKAVTPEEGEAPQDEKTSGSPDPKAKKKDRMGKSINLEDASPEIREYLDQVFKSSQAHAKRAEKLEAVVKSLQDAAEEKEYVAKAASEYGNLPLENQELGLMLKSAHDVAPEFAKGFETLLGRMNEMAKSFSTPSGAIAAAQSGDAWDRIEKIAEGMVQKSAEGGKGLTHAQAIDTVLKSDQGQALYREYLAENSHQRGTIY